MAELAVSLAMWMEENRTSDGVREVLERASEYADYNLNTSMILAGIIDVGRTTRSYHGVAHVVAGSFERLPEKPAERNPLGVQVPLSSNATAVLLEAAQLARETGDEVIRVRHLMAVLLKDAPQRRISAHTNLAANYEKIAADFLHYLSAEGDETASAFARYLGLPLPRVASASGSIGVGGIAQATKTSGASDTDPNFLRLSMTDWSFAAFENDGAGRDRSDHLNIRAEVRALSRVMMAKPVQPPLAIGLFGDWGTGKSFFMDKLYGEIESLAKGRVDGFCRDVVQIRFNAWHYMDTDLWSTLVGKVFDELAEYLSFGSNDDEGRAKRTRERLVEKLRIAKVQVGEAETRKMAAEAARVAAQAQLADVASRLEVRQRELADIKLRDVAQLLLSDPLVKPAIEKASRELNLDQVQDLAKRVESVKHDATDLRERGKTLWLAIRARPINLVWILVLTLGPAYAAHFLLANQEALRDWGSIVAGLAGAIASLLPRWQQVSEAAQTISKVQDRVREVQRRATENDAEQAALTKEVEQLSKTVSEIEAELADRLKEVRELDAKLEDIRSGKELAEFIRSRALSDDYRKRQGIIAMVRQDFEQLSDLLSPSEEKRSDEIQYIDRIVLYIDDLDRCPADRVIEVLQAVHLLLAFRLFVVVVGIDPSWLRNSLRHHYRVEMGGTPTVEVPPYVPERYLEKIFQIPFALKTMRPEEARALMTALTRPSSPAVTPATSNVVPTGVVEVSTSVSEPNSEPVERGGGEANSFDRPEELDANEATAMELTEAERTLLVEIAPCIPSPRAMKRLVNTYHLMRQLSGESLDYRPTLLALTLLVGLADKGGPLITRIATGGEKVSDVLAEKLGSQDLTAAARRVIEKVVEVGGEDASLERIRERAPYVLRFSFS